MALIQKSTQDFVPIKEIRDRVVILKDNSIRILLMASAQNFALKSKDEQEAILFQFQNFLNSLDFSVQFFIQSRKLDIRPYIALLEERQKEQSSELMKIQTIEYIDFIKTFTENVNIMTKTFFIVVPYTPPVVAGPKGLFSKIFPSEQKKVGKQSALEKFEENKTQLEQRASVVEQGLASTGIRVAHLGNEELVELYYKIFNPGELDKPVAPKKT